MRFWIFGFLGLLMVTRLPAATVLDQGVSWDLQVYRGAQSDPTLEQVLAEPGEWQAATSTTVNFGVSRAPAWLRLRINSQDLDKPEQRLLHIAYPTLDRINIWSQTAQGLLGPLEMGDQLPFSRRFLAHRDFIMPVTLQPGEQQTLYINATSTGSLIVPVQLITETRFVAREQSALLFHGVFIGTLFVVMVYTLLMAFITRESSFVLFFGYVVAITNFYASLYGFSFQYLWPNAIAWNQIQPGLSGLVGSFFLMRFFCGFLHVERFNSALNQAFLSLSWLPLLWIPLIGLFSYRVTVHVATNLGVVFALTCVAVACWMAFTGARLARHYLLAWGFFITGLLVFLIDKSGLFQMPAFAAALFKLGVLLQVLTLALALSYRLNLTRQKLFAAQQQALEHEIKLRETQSNAMKMVQQANQELELKVRERTAKLEETLTELHISHEKLKEHSTRDGLTGLRNRPYFDELFAREWRRVQREKGHLALIMMDIDNFKSINDDYGHLAGDICLKRVADLIRRSIHRPGDEVARYGGEEFSLLLPMTNGEGALKVAEDIRQLVEKLIVKIDNRTLNPTLSCGVAELQPSDNTPHLALLKMADIALYQAKEHGRNRSVLYTDEIPEIQTS